MNKNSDERLSGNKVVFISDAHLTNDNNGRERKLVNFLRSKLSRGDRLFIVGDLFDFWFEYKTVIPKQCLLILSCMKEMTDNGIRIDYIAGNHDFWVGDYFKKEIGINFHRDAVRETIDGFEFYITHGDGLKKNDGGYRFLKRVFRHPVNIFLYRWLHPDIGVPFARWCSDSSRKYTSKRDYGDNDEYQKFAEKMFSEGVEYVIMGHTHEPYIHRSDIKKIYINLGDWIEHFSYAEFFNGELVLNTYVPEQE